MNKAYFILFISIPFQFAAAFLALRLIWITKKTAAWIFIAAAIVLMSLRRCFTLYEWYVRGMELLPVDLSQELIAMATSVSMAVGVALIAPLFLEIKRAGDVLGDTVEERTAELEKSHQALQLELAKRQVAEESLRKSEVMFRTIADFTYDWEYWLGPDGRYYYNSPSCERITGYQAEDFFLDPDLLEKITHVEDRQKIAAHLRDERESGEPHHLDFRILTKDGEERWIAHVCQPVYSPTGHNLGRRAGNRDVTRQKQAEEEKAKLESQLRQTQKIEALGTLAGGIAHDFNNILSPIRMYTEIAMRDFPMDSPTRSYLDQVLKSSKRASDLVNQILSFSRQTERQRIFMQVGPIVKESLKLLRASFPSTIDLRQNIGADPDWVLADPTEVYQVVMNLCTNAAQALGDKGGLLEVVLDNVELTEGLSAFGIEIKPGPYVRLSVHDSGPGIPPAIIERIFEPYFTTKEKGQGTGLGLALVHGIVKLCAGGITVASEPGRGTTFEVFFPVMRTEELMEPEVVGDMPRGKESILVVDDEEDIVVAAKILLEQLGYRVTAFTASREALEAFRAQPDGFDLVLADQTMPHLSGLELAGELLKMRPGLPIIIWTGYSETLTPEKARALGFRELLAKPLVPRQLAESVRRKLDAGRGE
jgi:PAS domain S-box-containing protein